MNTYGELLNNDGALLVQKFEEALAEHGLGALAGTGNWSKILSINVRASPRIARTAASV